MSQDNLESLRESMEAFNRRDRAAWLPTVDRGAVMIPSAEWPENAPVRGAEAIWDYYVNVTEAWEEGPFEFDEIIESGNTLVAHGRGPARARASGVELGFSYWAVLTYRDGKLARAEWFAERSEALEASGLSE